MTGLTDISQVLLGRELLEATHRTLREIGQAEVEGLVLWAGRRQGSVFAVGVVLCPRQQAVRSLSGLCVLVDGDEIHRINTWLYKNGMELVAQVHSHPGEAYHSDLDDTIPLITTAGGLSLVVPDFAHGPADLASYAGYRLSERGEWVEVPSDLLLRLIRVAGDPS